MILEEGHVAAVFSGFPTLEGEESEGVYEFVLFDTDGELLNYRSLKDLFGENYGVASITGSNESNEFAYAV